MNLINEFFAGRAHLREALVLHEESQRLHRMCRELKGKATFGKILKRAQDTTLEVYKRAGSEDDFRKILDPPHIVGRKQTNEIRYFYN